MVGLTGNRTKRQSIPWRAVVATTFVGLSIGALGVALRIGFFSSATSVLAAFQQQDVPEARQADILILSGTKAEKIVLKSLPDKNAPKRRYMIGYLAAIRSTNSVRLLEKILNDVSEPDYIRADAFAALHTINDKQAKHLAKTIGEVPNDLKNAIDSVLNGDPRYSKRRSFWDAFWYRGSG